jgi:cytochrome P450
MEFRDLPQFDHDEVASRAASDFLFRCRREMPLVRLTSAVPERNLLLVAGPDAVKQVFLDTENISSTDHPQSRRFDSDVTPQTACIYAQQGLNLKNIAVWSDGAYHARVRKLIQFAFSTSQVAAKAPRIQATIDRLLDEIAAGGGAIDFVPGYANRLTTMVITQEFGLEAGDIALVRIVTDLVSAMVDTLAPPEMTAQAAPAIVELHRLLIQRLERREMLPEGCLLRHLADACADDEPALSRSELLWLATLILAAGGHTTAGMLSWCAYMLASRPDLADRLRKESAKTEDFVEEALRIHNPIRSHFRRVVRNTAIDGVTVPRGTLLAVRADSLNLDERVWEDSDVFDMDRPNVNRHSTFGAGKHFCIGNLLARKELNLTVASLLRRFKRIRFAVDPATIQPVHSFEFHILTSLPVILE